MYVSSSLFLPIVLAIFYTRIGETTIELHYLIINLAFVAVAFMVQSAIIAEEKEKNTLRGLMLSPATLPEILGGKSLVSLILTCITVVICTQITGYESVNVALISIAIIISSFFYLALGTLVGLLSRTVIEASMIMLPVMFVFGFGSFLPNLIDTYPILIFTNYLPNVQLIDLANKVQLGAGITEILGVILAWFIVSAILTVIVFKKKEMDE